jgi:hypothetical protein
MPYKFRIEEKLLSSFRTTARNGFTVLMICTIVDVRVSQTYGITASASISTSMSGLMRR